jgi:hypothetical protein
LIVIKNKNKNKKNTWLKDTELHVQDLLIIGGSMVNIIGFNHGGASDNTNSKYPRRCTKRGLGIRGTQVKSSIQDIMDEVAPIKKTLLWG